MQYKVLYRALGLLVCSGRHRCRPRRASHRFMLRIISGRFSPSESSEPCLDLL